MNFVVNLFVAVLLENFFQFQMQDSFVLSEVCLRIWYHLLLWFQRAFYNFFC